MSMYVWPNPYYEKPTNIGVIMYITPDVCCHASDDIIAAIRKLKVLGSGFTLIPIGSRYLVQSVPGELTMDHATVLQQAEVWIKT